MVKKVIAVLSISILIMISGCAPATTHMPPSGANPATLISNTNYPSMHNSITNYNFDRDDIEILGPVTVSTASYNLLYLFSWGNNGYGALLDQAKEDYPDADGLVNINYDTHYTKVLFFLFTRVKSTVTATAVRIKR
jgi:hypothetical protein